jgi:hypothetical protein
MKSKLVVVIFCYMRLGRWRIASLTYEFTVDFDGIVVIAVGILGAPNKY